MQAAKDYEKQAEKIIKNMLGEIKEASRDEETRRLAKSWRNYVTAHFNQKGRTDVLKKFKTDLQEIDLQLNSFCECN